MDKMDKEYSIQFLQESILKTDDRIIGIFI